MKNNQGFSLIELIITLTIIAALICIAYPSYMQHLVSVRRTNAVVVLMDLVGKMEQYYVQHNSYAGASVASFGEDDSSYKNYYEISISSASDTTYTLKANPINSQGQADCQCAVMTIDQSGEKTISGSGMVAECW